MTPRKRSRFTRPGHQTSRIPLSLRQPAEDTPTRPKPRRRAHNIPQTQDTKRSHRRRSTKSPNTVQSNPPTPVGVSTPHAPTTIPCDVKPTLAHREATQRSRTDSPVLIGSLEEALGPTYSSVPVFVKAREGESVGVLTPVIRKAPIRRGWGGEDLPPRCPEPRDDRRSRWSRSTRRERQERRKPMEIESKDNPGPAQPLLHRVFGRWMTHKILPCASF